MSLRDALSSGMRAVLAASGGLGETVSVRVLSSAMADRGAHWDDATTVTGVLVELASTLGFDDGNEADARSAVLRVSSADTELDVGDLVVHGGATWTVEGKEAHIGHFKYTLGASVVKRRGADR